MKKIIEEYGEVLIALLVAGIILPFFFGIFGNQSGGIAALLKEQVNAAGAFYLTDEESPEFNAYAGGGKVQVEYTNEPVIAGTKTPVTEHFRATLENGETAGVSICRICDSQGFSYDTQIEGGKEYMYLEEPGIYTGCLRTKDSCGRQRYARLCIPVQRKIA